MIYNFNVSDPVKKDFVGILRTNRIDFESVEFDRSVIRVLGVVPNAIEEELERIYNRRKQIVAPKESSKNIYDDFKNSPGPVVIAGPCSVESEEQISSAASFLKDMGIKYIRGGVYKPRTSPESFQGMGRSGLEYVSQHAVKHGLKVVSEVMDRSQIESLLEYSDILQVGSRNMFNYTLLTSLGSIDKPVLLKRGMAATIDEWLSAAEYISRGGNDFIILCERGIRTFEPRTRNTLDISAICIAQALSDFPIIADPSHATGTSDLVVPMTLAALSAGADGIMVEVHPNPDRALSDINQALSFSEFEQLLQKIRQHFPERNHPQK
jgi:3-deoxy-7-phosphoheptulonate synthase